MTSTAAERQCTARSKQSGERCKRHPSPGSPVCVIHGSRSPQAKRKAAERLAEQDALKLLHSMRIEPVGDPLTALQDLAGEVVAWKQLLAGKVAELNAIRYRSQVGEQLRAEVALFERALDRCANVLAAISKLNIDTRLAAVREREADMLERAMNAALIKIGLTDDQQRAARLIVAQEIRALPTGGPAGTGA